MSVTVLDDAWVVARKEHRCNACLGTIGVGDRYHRQKNVDDYVFTFKCHALCDAIWWRLARDYGLHDDEPLDPDEDVRPALTEWFDALVGAKVSGSQ